MLSELDWSNSSCSERNDIRYVLMMSQMTWTASALSKMYDLKMDDEIFISYLPLSHAAAQIFDIIGASSLGATIYIAQPDALKVSRITQIFHLVAVISDHIGLHICV